MNQTLRELRLKNNLTLSAVSREIGYDISNLSRVERGLQPLTLNIAQRLAAFYGVSLDYLVHGAS